MKVRSWSAAFISAMMLCLPVQAQQNAPQRFALLIGNSSYQEGVGPLENPKHDIDKVESALVQIGFPPENVRKRSDLTAVQLIKEVQDHASRVRAAGEGTVSFFYYSGHGAAAPPNTPGAEGNYIIPYDLESTARPDFWSRAVALDQVNKILRDAPLAKHIVIFDACRTELKLPGKDIVSRGFDPPLLSQDAEMLTAFATAPKTTARDSVEKGDYNGPYATAFAENVVKPGIDHLRLFSNVRTAVLNITHRQQIPWTHDGLLTPLVLYPSAPLAPDNGDDCKNIQLANQPVPETPIVWHEVPEKAWIRFKAHGFTYEAPRANAKLIEEVDEGIAHRVVNGGKIWEGTMNGQVAWYRYQRNVGSERIRHVVAADVELF